MPTTAFAHQQAPCLWRMGLVVGMIVMFFSTSVVTSSVPTGLDYQNEQCGSVFWNVSLFNYTTYNFTCSFQPLGSTNTLKTSYYCGDIDTSEGASCTCVSATLNGKACNKCSICNDNQASTTGTPILQVKSFLLDCDGVLGTGDVCSTNCFKGWTGCGGTQQTTAPTVYISPASAPSHKSGATVIPRADTLMNNVILGFAGVSVLLAISV